MKRTLIAFFAAAAIIACTKPVADVTPENTDPTHVNPEPGPEPKPVEPKFYNIPDEFKDCEFVAFVSSGSTCKDIVCASGWYAFADSLCVKNGQSIALVALSKGATYNISPESTGQPAKDYSVKPADGKDSPAIWSCKVDADSTNKATFNPVLRTFSLTLNVDNLPKDLDSISFDLKQSECVAPASPGQYAGNADNHYCLPVSKLGQTLNLLPMQTAGKEMFLVLNFHYKDKMRDCMVHFDKRASARYAVNVNLDMEEKDRLDSPELTVSGTNADGQEFSTYQQISLWNHGLSPINGLTKNEAFTFRSGTNLAFLYGSGVTWENGYEDKDLDEPWICPTNDEGIKETISLGFDHFRIPIDEEAFVYSDCSPRTVLIDDIKKSVNEIIKGGARVIIDLHWMKTCQSVPDAKNEAHYRACWQLLHDTFGDYSPDMLAYEFMNEPNAPAEYWNFFIKNSIDMVRQWGGKELNRVLICGCNHGQDVEGTDEIELPSDTDPNLVLSYHDYYPSNLTFYEKGNLPMVYLNYPGSLIKDEDVQYYTPEQLERIPGYFLGYEKRDLEKIIKQAAENGERLGVRVYVGEYGCKPWVTQASRQRWYQDKCDLFRKYDMAFANWFGIGRYPYDSEIDEVIVEAMIVD